MSAEVRAVNVGQLSRAPRKPGLGIREWNYLRMIEVEVVLSYLFLPTVFSASDIFRFSWVFLWRKCKFVVPL